MIARIHLPLPFRHYCEGTNAFQNPEQEPGRAESQARAIYDTVDSRGYMRVTEDTLDGLDWFMSMAELLADPEIGDARERRAARAAIASIEAAWQELTREDRT